MNILIDAYGGDNAPMEMVNGALLALYKYADLEITLVGKEKELNDILSTKSYDKSRLFIIPASEVISCDEAPVAAIRTKRDSSLMVAIDNLKTGKYAGLVSAGSTGAVLSAGVITLPRIDNVDRPGLASLLPTKNGGNVLLLDSGALADAKPDNLCQFAVLGNAFMQIMCGIETPRVALLSNGTEEHKGNQLTAATLPRLKELNINFVGNMEARDLLSGQYDVVVADGFAGNVLLKGVEGALKNLMAVLKEAMTSTLKAKIGALLVKKALKKELKKYDYEQYGGAPLLGSKYLLFKAHGSSTAKQILTSIEQIMDYAQKDLVNKLVDAMANTVAKEPEQSIEQSEKEESVVAAQPTEQPATAE